MVNPPPPPPPGKKLDPPPKCKHYIEEPNNITSIYQLKKSRTYSSKNVCYNHYLLYDLQWSLVFLFLPCRLPIWSIPMTTGPPAAININVGPWALVAHRCLCRTRAGERCKRKTRHLSPRVLPAPRSCTCRKSEYSNNSVGQNHITQ